MILGNSEILEAIDKGHIVIDPKPDIPSFEKPQSPFNTTALDLRLGNTISVPKEKQPFVFDLTRGGIASFLRDAYESNPINREGGFALQPGIFVISNTLEKVTLPIQKGTPTYAARVEGKSSFARIGLLIHFTAPTIHAGFSGTITLELMNLGKNPIMLYPSMYICQLIFERVSGDIFLSPSQFQGQTTPEGGYG